MVSYNVLSSWAQLVIFLYYYYYYYYLVLLLFFFYFFFFCASERAVRGRKERKETLTDKPLDFENRPLGLSCLSLRTDI